jgi:hypothetical protein
MPGNLEAGPNLTPNECACQARNPYLTTVFRHQAVVVTKDSRRHVDRPPGESVRGIRTIEGPER